jgi:hypothetical protein
MLQKKTCYDTHLPLRNTNLKLTIHNHRCYYTNRLTIDDYYRRIFMILLTSAERGLCFQNNFLFLASSTLVVAPNTALFDLLS